MSAELSYRLPRNKDLQRLRRHEVKAELRKIVKLVNQEAAQ